jgi:hypothetical protein
MRSRQDAILMALLRVRRFATDNGAELSSAVDLTVALHRLDDVIAKLSTHALEQDANRRSAKGETEKQQQLRLTLRTEQMRLIAEIARRSLRAVPEFKALQMPPRSAKGTAFLASAKAMVDAATLHKTALFDRGLPADTLDLFQAGLTQLAASLSDRDQSRTRRKGATKGLAVQEQEGASVLRVLDMVVRRALKKNQALLGAWDGARLIQRRPGGKATTYLSTVATPSIVSETTAVGPATPAA